MPLLLLLGSFDTGNAISVAYAMLCDLIRMDFALGDLLRFVWDRFEPIRIESNRILGGPLYFVIKTTSSGLELARPLRLACLPAFGPLHLESSPVLAGICGLCRPPLLPWPEIPQSQGLWKVQHDRHRVGAG